MTNFHWILRRLDVSDEQLFTAGVSVLNVSSAVQMRARLGRDLKTLPILVQIAFYLPSRARGKRGKMKSWVHKHCVRSLFHLYHLECVVMRSLKNEHSGWRLRTTDTLTAIRPPSPIGLNNFSDEFDNLGGWHNNESEANTKVFNV